MKALALEFYKTRGRKVWLVVFALIAVQLLWMLWSLRSMREQKLDTGWMYFLYEFPALNTLMMPVIAAVVASRLCDTEHQGRTLKLLKTVMPAGRLFGAKFLCGSIYMAAAAVFQVAMMLLGGSLKGFRGAVPVQKYLLYLLFTVSVSLTLLLFQQVLSLLAENQMIPLAVGLIGAFAGVFLMFLPKQLSYLLPWGYYMVLEGVSLEWNKTAGIVRYHYVPENWFGLAVLAAVFLVIYLTGRFLFIKKEV